MKKTLKITDLDFSFRAHPVTGNLVVKNGADVIKQSVKTLVLLNMFEKPFSTVSGNITNRLFDQFNYVLENDVRNTLLTLFNLYEPRIEVNANDIIIQNEENTLNITIYYIILGEDVPKQEVNIEVTRSR
jgi:hypothetical protein